MYELYNILDRLNEFNIVNDCQFSKKLGMHPAWWARYYRRDLCCPKVLKLYEFAKKLDVSFEYLLTGRHKGSFVELKLDIKNIWKNYRVKKISNQKLSALVHYIKIGATKDIHVDSLFAFSGALGIEPVKLLTEVKND